MSDIFEPSEIVSKMDGLTLQEEGISVKIKRPKRVLHFSDGVIEEYSTDDEKEDVVDSNDDSNKVVDEVIFHMCLRWLAFRLKNNKIRPWVQWVILGCVILTVISFFVQSKLNWGPWLSLKAWRTGSTVLAGCDYVGETLASFLGITSHKYSYEIEQFKKLKEQEAEQEREDKEAGTFIEKTNLNGAACITEQPEQEQIKKY